MFMRIVFMSVITLSGSALPDWFRGACRIRFAIAERSEVASVNDVVPAPTLLADFPLGFVALNSMTALRAFYSSSSFSFLCLCLWSLSI
jgi:hypothetical protein